MLPFFGILAVGLFIAVVRWPQIGAYVFLLVNPFIVGIARGEVSASLRPNELLLFLILGALGLRAILAMLSGSYRSAPFDRLDVALLCLAVTSSVIPLFWRAARGLELSQEDLLYSAVFIKYYLLYRFFRSAIITPAMAGTCLWLSMLSASLVAGIAMLQVSNLFGVPEFLLVHYDAPFEGHTSVQVERGTSTVASAFGLGDMMIMNLIISLGLLRTTQSRRWILFAAVGVFLSGCIVAGEFSGYIGLLVAVIVFGALSGTLHRQLPIGLALTGLAAIPFWSVIERRLAGFQGEGEVPHSWKGRWENLERFFFPDLISNFNWLLGVRPGARVLAPEKWRTWVYIESGYIWLLWIGGVPLLASFIFFAWVALRSLYRVTSLRADAVGVAATASFCFLIAMIVLMALDPHLTLRGAADLFFPLLALAFVRAPAVRRPYRDAEFRGPPVIGGMLAGVRRAKLLHLGARRLHCS